MRLGPQHACGSHTVEVTVPTGDACDTLLLPQRVLARSAVAYLVIPPGALLLCTPVNAPGEDIHPQLRLPLDSQSHQSCPWSRKQCSEEMGVGGYPKCKTCSQKKKNLLQTVNAAGDDSVRICPPKELTKLIMGFSHNTRVGLRVRAALRIKHLPPRQQAQPLIRPPGGWVFPL